MNCSLRKIAASLAPAALIILFAFPASAQQSSAISSSDDKSQFASIAGTVLRSGTDEPLRKAQVTLSRRDDKSPRSREVVTGADGKFVIEGVAPGEYDLSADHDGYVEKSYGENSTGRGAAVLSLAAGQSLSDLIFRLPKCAVISGRVADEDGDPVSRVNVEAVRRTTYHGKAMVSSFGQSETNDLGEYRLFDLVPGRYCLRATPRGSQRTLAEGIASAGGSSDAKAANTYVMTYYPDATDVSRASILELKPGDEAPSMDISLVRSRTYKIRGQVINTGSALGFAVIASLKDDFESSPANASMTEKNGMFEIAGLTPGSYLLRALASDEGRHVEAVERVEITNADLDSVKIVVKGGTDILGRLTMEGQPALPKILMVSIFPKDDDFDMGGSFAQVKPDGSFHARNVFDGTYQVTVRSDCKDCYLKSAKMNGIDVLKNGLQLAGGIRQPLELLYSNRSATVDGVVIQADDLPAVGALVVLVPDSDYREWSGRFEIATTDQYGRFTIRGVAPGTYKAYAFKKPDENFDPEDPEFIKPFESKGESVSLDENGKQTLRLKLIDVASENPSK
ncbi:MAG: carboxypeptidase-like regulatory domain-containing protein [Candidatus Acidiferrales bacterium]